MAQAGAIAGIDGWIGREADVDRVVAALTSGDGGLVVVVPEPDGVEGLGLTTVVAAALRRPEVAARFPEGIGWLNFGGSHSDEQAAEFTEALEHLHGEDVELFAHLELDDLIDASHDEEAAGELLREQIFQPGPRLMVVDGLRHAGMVVPLALAVPGCTWLVTARTAGEELPFAVIVGVGPLSVAQSTALLRRDLPALDEDTATRLAELTGGWPLALTMAHGLIVSQVVTGEPATEAAARLADRLPGRVDLCVPGSRARLAGALVDHSLGWLRTVDPAAAERFLQLGLFGPGEGIPIGVAALMWSSGGGVTGGRIGALIARLEGLRLLRRRTDHPVLGLADAVGERVRELLGADGLERARRALIEADPEETPEGWAELPGTGEWMMRNLARLYAEAGDTDALRELVRDGSFLGSRIHRSGVDAALDDLARADDDTAASLARVLAGSSHLLESARELGVGVLPTLAARLHATPGAGADLRQWLAEQGSPWLEHRGTPPDLPHEALVRTHHSRAERMTGLAMSPDGAWLAAAGDQGRVSRWSLDGTAMRALLGHESEVTCVAVAPGGAWLATGSWDGTVRLWEGDGRLRAVLGDLPETARTIAIAPDARWGVVGGEGFLWFFDADGTVRATPEEAEEDYEAVAVAPDGSWVVAVGSDVTELWDAHGRRTAVVEAVWEKDEDGEAAVENNGGEAVAVAPSGEWLALLSRYGTVRLLNPDGTPRAELHTVFSHGTGLAIAPDSRWLAVSDFDDHLVILDPDGTVRARLHGHPDTITGLAITPDGRLLVSASRDHTVRVWDVALALRPGATEAPARYDLRGIAVAGDGSYLATVGMSGLTLWHPDGTVRVQATEDWLRSVAVAADGAYVLGVDSDGGLRLHDRDGTVRATADAPGAGPMLEPASAIAPDGTWLAVSTDHIVRILSSDLDVIATLEPSGEEVTALAIAPDSSWLAIATDHEIRRWTRDGRPLGLLAETDNAVEALAVAPGGRHVAAGTIRGMVELFEVTGTRTARFGQDDWLTDLAFSPDGTRLATAALHGCLRVWDVSTYATECGIVVHGELHGCAWHPDGSALYAAGEAGLFAFTYHRGT
uniref:WD-40 repeat protein n=1 Tax=Nonomuraea gerenzanensis TaxID=93944 RepID=A0A1M4EAF2_9ACTN|nr:WD-40 repeat protein [Nonomuraea gerenzanensis]